MSNGNGRDMEVDTGVCFANTFNGKRPDEGEKGEKAPLFQEGRFIISPEVAALAQLSGGAYVTIYGHSELRKWIREAEAAVGKMRGGAGIRFTSKAYKRDEESLEAVHKRIIVERYGKPTGDSTQEAQLASAMAFVGISDAPWLKEHTV